MILKAVAVDKNYIRMHMRSVAIQEVDNKGRWMPAHTVNSDGTKSSLADRVCSLLNDSARKDGVKGHLKHAKREEARSIKQREYFAVHHNNATTNSDSNSKLPIVSTDFALTKKSFEKGEYNGLRGYYYEMIADVDFNPA